MRLLLSLIVLAGTALAGITVTKSHPNRLMVDETRLAAVQAKIGTQAWTDFQAVIDANKDNTSSSDVSFLTSTALGSALICRATGDATYCTKALAQMDAAAVKAIPYAQYGLTVDTVHDWVIDPVGIFSDSTGVFAGLDLPIKYLNSGGNGVLPAPLAFNTTYWLRWHHVDNSAGYHSYWTIAATRGGAPIDLSGAVSGSVSSSIPWRMASGIGGNNYPRWFLGTWPVLYDWLYDYMTPEQKTEWYNQLRASMQFVAVLDYDGGGKILNNVWVGDHRGGALYGIAIIGDDPADTAAVQTVLDKLDADFTAELATNGAFLTGGFIEGTEYTPEQQYCLWELWDGILISSGRSDDRFTALQAYYTGIVDYYTHAFHTGSFVSGTNTYKDIIAHGEILQGGVGAQGGLWNVRINGAKVLAPDGAVRRILLYLQETMNLLGDAARSSYVKQLLDNYTPLNGLKNTSVTGLADVIYERPAVNAAYWNSSPLVKWFTGTNEIFMKSGWDPGATNVNIFGTLTLSGSGGIDHIKSEAGAFSFYRKGVTLTGNWTAYPYDTSNNMPYSLQRYPGSGVWASSYSTLLPASVPPNNNLIGYGTGIQAAVSRFESSGLATYGDMNLTGVYQHSWGAVPPLTWDWANRPQLVTGAHREWMYLAPDILVIHDKVTKYQATPASQWNLQAQAHPVAVSGNTVTIDGGAQFLQATVLLPANPKIVVKRSDRVYVQWVSREAAPMLVFEANIAMANNEASTVTLSGAAGEWAVLNGTWHVTALDPRNVRIDAGQVNTSGIASGFGGQALVLEGHGTAAPMNNLSAAYDTAPALTGGHYVEVGGVEATKENFFVVLEGVDAAAAPSSVTALAATNIDAAQIGDRVVGFVRQAVAWPISYTHGASGEHRIAGLPPGTTYQVDVSTAGRVVIRASGAGVAATTTDAGELVFYPTGPEIIPPRLTVSPEQMAFQCTVGGAAGSQPLSLGVAAGGLSSWTVSGTMAWLSTMPASGTAAGALDVSVDCTGLLPGEYNDTLTFQSVPAFSVGSVNSVAVRLRVDGEAALRGGSAVQGGVRVK